jgi:hypothetical protein
MSRIPGGPLNEKFSQLRLANGTVTLNGATSVTEEVDGTLVFTGVPGGTATPNPTDATYISWPAKDFKGGALSLSATDLTTFIVKLVEDLAPSLTSDTYMAVGLADAAALTTADGFFCGPLYTGGDRDCRGAKVVAGVTTATDGVNLGATYDTTFGTASFKAGITANYLLAYGVASSDLATSLGQSSRFLSAVISGDIYVFVVVGRTSAAAGAVTVKLRAGLAGTSVVPLSSGFQ